MRSRPAGNSRDASTSRGVSNSKRGEERGARERGARVSL